MKSIAKRFYRAPRQTVAVPAKATVTVSRLVTVEDEADKTALDELFEQVKYSVNAIIDGVTKDGLYNLFTPEGIPACEFEIYAECNEGGRKSLSKVLKAKGAYEQRRDVLNREILEKRQNSKEKFQKLHAEDISKDREEVHAELHQIPKLAVEEVQHRRKKEDAASKQNKIKKERYGDDGPQPWLVHNKRAYFLLLFLGFSIDSPLLYFAIDAMPDNDLPGIFIALVSTVIGVFLMVANHFTGIVLAGQAKKLELWAPISMVISLLAIVFYVRSGEESSMILTLATVAVCILASYWSYLRHKDGEYFKYADAADYHETREDFCRNEPARIERRVEEKLNQVDQHWAARETTWVEEQVAPLTGELQEVEKAIEQFDLFILHEVILPYQAFYESSVTRLHVNIMKARASNKLEQVSFGDGPAKPLDFHKPVFETRTSEKASRNGHAENGFSTAFKTTVAGLFLAGLTSCAGPDLLYKRAVVIGDETMSIPDTTTLSPAGDKAAFVFTVLEFEPYADPGAVSRDRVRIDYAVITDRFTTPVITPDPLPEDASSMMVNSKRRKLQNHFVEENLQMLKTISQPSPEGKPYSYVQACLCEALMPVALSDDDLKAAVIFSDVIINNPRTGVDFYRYKKQGNLLDDYESIAEKLDQQCPAMKASGLGQMAIYIVHLPRSDLDDFFARSVKPFWQRYLVERGAGSIKFLSGLPRSNRNLAAQ